MKSIQEDGPGCQKAIKREFVIEKKKSILYNGKTRKAPPLEPSIKINAPLIFLIGLQYPGNL